MRGQRHHSIYCSQLRPTLGTVQGVDKNNYFLLATLIVSLDRSVINRILQVALGPVV